ncbi:hypothetical protein [Streptomyces similanensis]|uniref:Transposase n=1 Tax=Streptomyces similanensis TaxID=1274988 RepID=A0ABP9L7X2_9ACTN
MRWRWWAGAKTGTETYVPLAPRKRARRGRASTPDGSWVAAAVEGLVEGLVDALFCGGRKW